MPKIPPEYAVKIGSKGPLNEVRYEVVKFVDGVVANTYDVYFGRNNVGFCNCYAGARKGNADKHVGLVRRWLNERSPPGKLYTL